MLKQSESHATNALTQQPVPKNYLHTDVWQNPPTPGISAKCVNRSFLVILQLVQVD